MLIWMGLNFGDLIYGAAIGQRKVVIQSQVRLSLKTNKLKTMGCPDLWPRGKDPAQGTRQTNTFRKLGLERWPYMALDISRKPLILWKLSIVRALIF